MSVQSVQAGIHVPTRSQSEPDIRHENSSCSSSSRSPALVEQFYEKHHSFKANNAPAVDRAEIKSVFDYFDENHDELISQNDLQQFLGRLGFNTNEEEIRSMVSFVDRNGDGSVDFEEFASLYNLIANDEFRRDGDDNEDLKDAFHVFDKNDDGFISPSELQEVLLKLGMDEGMSLSNCVEMINNVDSDGNGSVDFGEFKKMMSGAVGGSKLQ